MKYYILTILFLTTQLISYAHEDTLLKLSNDGKLLGLPEKYSNALFDSTTMTLKINNKQIIIPECVLMFYKDYKNYKLTFSASWYHEDWVMPYYLCMDITSFEHPMGFQVLFNLDTLEIFQISKIEISYNRNKPILQYYEQELSEECHKSILNSIVQL